jgi:hypothetical protein
MAPLVLNLRLPTDRLFDAGMAKVPDLASVARLADKKPVELQSFWFL